jgi:hypothetical protein
MVQLGLCCSSYLLRDPHFLYIPWNSHSDWDAIVGQPGYPDPMSILTDPLLDRNKTHPHTTSFRSVIRNKMEACSRGTREAPLYHDDYEYSTWRVTLHIPHRNSYTIWMGAILNIRYVRRNSENIARWLGFQLRSKPRLGHPLLASLSQYIRQDITQSN